MKPPFAGAFLLNVDVITLNMKTIRLLALILIAVCSSSTSQKSKAQPIDWKTVFERAENKNLSDSSRWSSKDDTIYFSGSIVEGDCEEFKRSIPAYIKHLTVNSQGGLVSESLCIANEMEKRKFLKTTVDGVCFSSCANYLFLASPRRVIKKGIVGFHGNLTALVKEKPELLKQFPKKIAKEMAEERKFFNGLAISQDLFSLTQKADKGNNDNKNYLFLLPTKETFEKHGILNVEGSQDLSLLNLLNEKGVLMLHK